MFFKSPTGLRKIKENWVLSMNLLSRVPEYILETSKTQPRTLDSTTRDYSQVVADLEELLVHSVKVLNLQDEITVQLQVLLQSVQEQV